MTMWNPLRNPESPLRWRDTRSVTVSIDLFDPASTDAQIQSAVATMAAAGQHTFRLATRFAQRMRAMLPDTPLPNLAVGVGVSNQREADERIPVLLDTPAAYRWVSCEPLLGSVDLSDFIDRWRDDDAEECNWGRCRDIATAVRRDYTHDDPSYRLMVPVCAAHRGIDQIVVSGEGGPEARPTHPNWVRRLRDHSQATGIQFQFTGWGAWVPDEWTDLDGIRHVGRKPDASDPRSLVMHPAGMTALRPDNPFDPWKAGHPGWNTVMRRWPASAMRMPAARMLDGRLHG